MLIATNHRMMVTVPNKWPRNMAPPAPIDIPTRIYNSLTLYFIWRCSSFCLTPSSVSSDYAVSLAYTDRASREIVSPSISYGGERVVFFRCRAPHVVFAAVLSIFSTTCRDQCPIASMLQSEFLHDKYTTDLSAHRHLSWLKSTPWLRAM